MRVRAEKDFWAGFLYLAIATAFLWLGRDYRLGTASRMGPGYFPLVLGWLLFGFGALSLLRSFRTDGERVGGIGVRPLVAITVAVVVFATLIPTAGLAFALPALVIISATASSQTIYDLRSGLALITLTLFCILVFVKGLGVPMPLLGSWFDGLIPPSWQR